MLALGFAEFGRRVLVAVWAVSVCRWTVLGVPEGGPGLDLCALAGHMEVYRSCPRRVYLVGESIVPWCVLVAGLVERLCPQTLGLWGVEVLVGAPRPGILETVA